MVDMSTGGIARITVTALPADGGTVLVNTEYQIDDGPWVSMGMRETGTFDIIGMTDGVPASISIRAANAVGNAIASAAKSVTPTAPVPSYIDFNLQNTGALWKDIAGTQPAVVGDEVLRIDNTGIAGGSLLALSGSRSLQQDGTTYYLAKSVGDGTYELAGSDFTDTTAVSAIYGARHEQSGVGSNGTVFSSIGDQTATVMFSSRIVELGEIGSQQFNNRKTDWKGYSGYDSSLRVAGQDFTYAMVTDLTGSTRATQMVENRLNGVNSKIYEAATWELHNPVGYDAGNLTIGNFTGRLYSLRIHKTGMNAAELAAEENLVVTRMA